METNYGATLVEEVELKVLQVFSITPEQGEGGDTVQIQGEFYGANWLGVYFDISQARVIDHNDTLITAIVPDISSSADVVVRTDYENSQPLAFEYYHQTGMQKFIASTNSVDISVSCLSKTAYCESHNHVYMDWECDTSNWEVGISNVSTTDRPNQYIEWTGNEFNLNYEFFSDYPEYWSGHLIISGEVSDYLDTLRNISASYGSGNGTAHHYSSSARSASAINIPVDVINAADTVVIFHISGISLEPSRVSRGSSYYSNDMDIDYYQSQTVENDPTSAEYPPEVTIKFYKRN